MIAEVYPILKLPRKCAYFDYEIPADLDLSLGDLVRIPFKGREVLGLVRGVKEHSEAQKLIALNSIARAAYVTQADIARYERIAFCLVQSVSSLLHATFPTIFSDGHPPFVRATKQSRLNTRDLPVLEKCLQAIEENSSTAIAGDRDIGFALAYALRRKRPEQMLILLPRERDAELLTQYVSLGDNVTLLHGHTAPKDRARITEAWRTGNISTLIGTRNASLLPAKSLTTVLMLECGNEEFFNERRNPRFDARETAKLLAEQHQAHFVVFDALPRLEEIATSPLVTTVDEAIEDIVINLGSAEEISAEPLLSDSVISGIEMALQSQKRVLLFLNRKGVAKRLQCGKCGHIPVCGTCGHVPTVRHDDLVCANCQTEMWIPAQCPACHKPKLSLRGIGGAKIVTTLQRLFPSASVGRLEKGSLENVEADILVATEYFFSSHLLPFSAKRFGLVADLAADIALHASDFRGSEETARKLHRLINFAQRQEAKVLIQTWVPDVLRPMLNLRTFTQAELDIRRRYQLPPYRQRYILQDVMLDSLPPDLAQTATEREGSVEIQTAPDPLQSLPDSVKIVFDGVYAQSHESSSRT